MQLGDFVKSVLLDVENALAEASKTNDKKYFIKHEDGLAFDVAVTVNSSTDETATGKVGAGISVLGAHVEGQKKTVKESSEVSRIQFKVYVPNYTETSQKSDIAEAESARAEKIRQYGL